VPVLGGGSAPANHKGIPVERRQLTVLFCDLVASTEMSARLDPEDLREVIAAYHQCVAETVRPFDGYVARYMGDGALIYFGYPVGHEDNAERALHAASALVANVRKLAVLGQTLHLRVGVATGLVVVGELVNTGLVRERTALGETPNLAARLQAIAEPDTVVVADSTKRLAGERFVYRDLGALLLKGFDAPQRAWQVIGRPRIRHASAALRPAAALLPGAVVSVGPTPLVGREQELGLLRERWEQVVEGHGRVVLLTGDPGIGKSRLVQSLIASCSTEPHVLLELRCSAQYANSPLYPVTALLPNVLSWGRSDSDATKLEKLLRFCDRYAVSAEEGVPLLMALLGMPASPRFPLPPMSPERQKQRTLQTFIGAVLAVAVEHPVLAVVEDLHWIDPTTMEFLTLLVDQVPTVRMLVLLTARLHFQAHWPPHSHVTPIVLTRFSRRQAAEMVERVAGAGRLPPGTVTEIVDRTDGVPLFVEEMTKAVLESRSAEAEEERLASAGPAGAHAIPLTLQDSLTARLDLLSTVKVIAQLGATLGREFPYALLRAVADVDQAVLDHELARLVEAEFLYQRGVGPEATFVFKHTLIQEAAYQSLLRSTRQQYHRRIAQVMVEQFPGDADARPEYVATQFTEGGELVAAVQWWQRAGQHAFRRAAFREAAVHFGKGLTLLMSAPASPRRDQMELALQVELGYTLIPISGWASADTAQAFRRAGELCRHSGDTPVLFRALWGLGAFHFVRGDQREAREVAEQCLAVARAANDENALCQAHYLCGITACVIGEFVAGQRHLEQCIRLYREENREAQRVLYGQDAKASALGWLAMALWVEGQPDEALQRAEEGLASVRDARQPFLLARGLAGVGFVHVFRGEPQGVGSPMQAALDLCVEQGFTYFHAVVSAFAGTDLVHQGRIEEGVARMESSVRTLRAIGAELLFTMILSNLASAYLAQGRVDEGLAAIDDGLQCVERTGERWAEAELHRVRGELLLARGAASANEAAFCFGKAVQIARGQHAQAYVVRAEQSLARLERVRDDKATLARGTA
jgi:class 3 adenylate cyclase/tetratricopeptide (TPR) repeat protein